MKKLIASTVLTIVLASLLPTASSAQVISPDSNKSVPGRAHTQLGNPPLATWHDAATAASRSAAALR